MDIFDNFDLNFLSGDINIFSQDINSVYGKNVIWNFLGKVKGEIKFMGYSNSANEIAEFYDKCKKSGKVSKFFSNPVINMILKEMVKDNTVKNYLEERIFDLIKEEQIQLLNNILENNTKKYTDLKIKEQEYIIDKKTNNNNNNNNNTDELQPIQNFYDEMIKELTTWKKDIYFKKDKDQNIKFDNSDDIKEDDSDNFWS